MKGGYTVEEDGRGSSSTLVALADAPIAFQQCRPISSLEVCTMTLFRWLRKINDKLWRGGKAIGRTCFTYLGVFSV